MRKASAGVSSSRDGGSSYGEIFALHDVAFPAFFRMASWHSFPIVGKFPSYGMNYHAPRKIE